MPTRRIIRSDAYNWSIQEFQEGGETIARGRFAGQETRAKWKNPERHYPTLADAARAWVAMEIDDGTDVGEPIMSNIIDQIQAARDSVTKSIQSLCEAQKDDFLIGILQERGYTVTNGKKGRSSYVEDDVEKGE